MGLNLVEDVLLILALYGFVLTILGWTVFIERDRSLAQSVGEENQTTGRT